MYAYKYHEFSWRVHGEINRRTVAVQFLNAKEAPYTPRFYEDGPQRQLSIFDLFEFPLVMPEDQAMKFLYDADHFTPLRITANGTISDQRPTLSTTNPSSQCPY